MEARLGRREEYQNYLKVLRAELDRLTRLMQRLLDYGKPPSSTFSPARAGDVIEDAIEAVRSLANVSGVELRTYVEPNLPPAAIDADRLMQVLQHVLDNAVQHSPPRGTVDVEAKQVESNMDRFIELAVSDNGPGFRPEELRLVLEPFFTRRRGGTGLGLAIVQRIVEGYKGHIFIENRIGGGARVALRLPPAHNGGMR
jgi:signal transduction histidine kinase